EPGVRRIIIYSPTNAFLPAGLIARVPVTVASDSPEGSILISLTNVTLADYNANSITPFQTIPGSLSLNSSAPEPPVIIEQPSAQAADVGSDVILHVTATGT